MTIKNIAGKITFERAFWLAAIIALLILLKTCGTSRDAAVARARMADSLRVATEQDRAAEAAKAWEYKNNAQQAQYEAKQADTAKRRELAKVSALQAQIRALGRPTDPTVIVMTDSLCCELGRDLADRVDSLQRADSAKDYATAFQLDLAGSEIGRLNGALDRERDRYDLLDSLNTEALRVCKPRGSVWLGAEGYAGPVAGAGVYLKYQTRGDKEYSVSGGRQQQGWYGGVRVGFKIKFGKR